jgi:hypothetical protein
MIRRHISAAADTYSAINEGEKVSRCVRYEINPQRCCLSHLSCKYYGVFGRVLEVTEQVAVSARGKFLLNGSLNGSTFSRLILRLNVNSQTNR